MEVRTSFIYHQSLSWETRMAENAKQPAGLCVSLQVVSVVQITRISFHCFL